MRGCGCLSVGLTKEDILAVAGVGYCWLPKDTFVQAFCLRLT